jgi:cell wall-associated NlpC family hydrolase
MIEYVDLLSKQFAYGGRGPDKYDCYGLVMEMYKRRGVIIPDYGSPTDQKQIHLLMDQKKQVWRNSEIKKNTVLLFRVLNYNSHVGYLVSDTHFIHTRDNKLGIVVNHIKIWEKRIVGCYEYIS